MDSAGAEEMEAVVEIVVDQAGPGSGSQDLGTLHPDDSGQQQYKILGETLIASDTSSRPMIQ